MKILVTGCIDCPFLRFEDDQYGMWCWFDYVRKEGNVDPDIDIPKQVPSQCALFEGGQIVVEQGVV